MYKYLFILFICVSTHASHLCVNIYTERVVNPFVTYQFTYFREMMQVVSGYVEMLEMGIIPVKINDLHLRLRDDKFGPIFYLTREEQLNLFALYYPNMPREIGEIYFDIVRFLSTDHTWNEAFVFEHRMRISFYSRYFKILSELNKK